MVVFFVRATSGRKRYNVLGAINPFSKTFVSLRNTGYVTATTVCELLTAPVTHNVGLPITLGNARYQKCELVSTLAKDLSITLLHPPSYSPNLNLIERLWKFVKKTSRNSVSYNNFAEFQAAVDQYLDEIFTTYSNNVLKLLTTSFQTFENAPILPP